MSRTYRKPLRVIEENETNYIKKNLGYNRRWNRYTNHVRRRKPEDQYQAEVAAAELEWIETLKKASFDADGRPYIGTRWAYTGYVNRGLVLNYIYKPRPYRYHYVTIEITREDEIEQLRKQYAKFTRDGHWNETGRNTGFKKASAKAVRNGNRRLKTKIMKDEDYDHVSYPNDHDHDYLVWSFW